MLAFYLECDLDDIEKQARRLAESTTLSYSEALHKIGGDMLRSKPQKTAPLSRGFIGQEPVRPNRAARRAAKRKEDEMDDNKNKPMGWPILYTLATLAGVAMLAILKLRHYINELAGGDRRARVGTHPRCC